MNYLLLFHPVSIFSNLALRQYIDYQSLISNLQIFKGFTNDSRCLFSNHINLSNNLSKGLYLFRKEYFLSKGLAIRLIIFLELLIQELYAQIISR